MKEKRKNLPMKWKDLYIKERIRKDLLENLEKHMTRLALNAIWIKFLDFLMVDKSKPQTFLYNKPRFGSSWSGNIESVIIRRSISETDSKKRRLVYTLQITWNEMNTPLSKKTKYLLY